MSSQDQRPGFQPLASPARLPSKSVSVSQKGRWATGEARGSEGCPRGGGPGASRPRAFPGPGCSAPGRGRESAESARARPGGPAHTAAAWEAAAAQPLARPPPERPSPLTHSPRPAARAEGATSQKQGGPAVRRAAIGAGGSAPPAAAACGRSRTRRRSALSGSRPALLRGEPGRGLETPSLPRDWVLSSFPARTSSLGRVVAGTRENLSAQNENVYCSGWLFFV